MADLKVSQLTRADALDGTERTYISKGTDDRYAFLDDYVSPVSAISTSAHNLVAADASKYLRFTYAGAKTCTVQPNATEPLRANREFHLRNVTSGDLTIVAGSGVTINVPSGGSLVVPAGGTVTLKRVAADEFDLMGQTVAP